MDHERARRRELSHLGARQATEADALLKNWPKVRRVRVDNSEDRPGLERAVAAYHGLVSKAVVCSCGHAATVRAPLGARLVCSSCGKGA